MYDPYQSLGRDQAMTFAADRARAFDRAFQQRAPDVTMRPEEEADADFLRALFIACSPLAGLLPPAMLVQQADLQQAGHARQCPGAMRRIVLSGAQPIGRIILDWSDPLSSLGVDIAVLPDARPTRAGRNLLHAWLEVCEASNLTPRLIVLRENPAAAIYRGLGFVEDVNDDPHHPLIWMSKSLRP